ncbi:MAG: Fructose-bisphosphate aldolase [Candidatus Roizmanbacteria bacterium GW2011_GWB1_40_7]|uniref:Fructose-bisphosphate aldolase n=2 Tax=Candidatus Roizmaniibacteriota TaxID=1752723 RepID=A0A0G0ZHU5_9BACT|nr:MAG: Fructose-bisphosphate aldolase [Candidatus Levybacteria bacterium GW2011_GWA2_40_16]KKR72495.1 MAG: Fructose-bisphosphate aldolase [Candidatus Roizmanbacteria bacterium GW2011_GWB1_40_7]KKS21601.1 MAG: Fructose-bisphosphate aldolase [Candidatus Roizmanbacteria bacterium GW2011_GWC2_41_7]
MMNQQRSNLSSITKNNRALFLAYDQGLEHGPSDFNDKNANPEFIIQLAESGYFTGVIFQKGIAKQYYDKTKHTTPLIVKLNGKTTLQDGEPFSPRLCSVEEAIDLGAQAVGYTIFPGSKHQEQMMNDFARVEEVAHNHNMPVILWLYPRGEKVKGKEKSKEISEYSARIGLELGADLLKMYYPDEEDVFPNMVKLAGRVGILVSGGNKLDDTNLYEEAQRVMHEGAAGMAVGRNIWQSENPLERAEELAKIIFG